MAVDVIDIEGKRSYLIGCRKCNTWDRSPDQHWRIYTDGNDFTAECTICGHKTAIGQKSLRQEADPSIDTMDLRFFT